MKTNQEFKNAALASLKGNWAPAVLLTVLYVAIVLVVTAPYATTQTRVQEYARENMSYSSTGGFSRIMSEALALSGDAQYQDLQRKSNGTMALMYLLIVLVMLPFSVGFVNAFLRLLRQRDPALVRNAVTLSTQNYWHKTWGMLLMNIFIWLWSLLLIVPGIIKRFSYAMTPYILEENPELSAGEAIDRSRAMMRGHKFDLFWLYLSFIGWFFLAILTLGIGTLWLAPYVQASEAAFYEEVKAEYAEKGGLV